MAPDSSSTASGSGPEDLWIFGYGSLVWKHDDVPHTDSRVCFVRGYKRRAWQGSTDHRGTPQAPGRVVGLYSCADFEKMEVVEKDTAQLPLDANDPWEVYGVAFKVTKEHREKVIESLNYREMDGYEPQWLSLFVEDRNTNIFVERALTYVAPPTNPRFMGFASHDKIATHISTCSGPSGPNLDYIRNLRDALVRMGHPDHHISSIVKIACES